MITMNVFSDNHYKCNRPIVGSEGEEPVGQNPVVGESDPGNLTGINITNGGDGDSYWDSLTASCSTLVIVQWSLAVPPDYGTVLNHHWWSWLISSLWWGTWAWRRHLLLHKIWHFTEILLHWRSWQRAPKKQKDSSHLPFYTLWRKPTVFHTTLLLHLTNIWLHVFILCQWGPLTFQGDSLLVYIQTI